MFSQDIDLYIFIQLLLRECNSIITSPSELVSYNNDIVSCVSYWKHLKEDLKWNRRFLTDLEVLKNYGWDSFFGERIILSNVTKLYRSRIHNDLSISCFPKEEMKCPRKEKVLNGRANPQGIPFLYLCSDKETTFYETRSTFLDEVSVGVFMTVDDNRVELIDFTEETSLFINSDSVVKYVKSVLLKRLISVDLSKPMRRYDSDIEYIPTQFICEYIKNITGADGIIFNSSLHQGGKNIVLFNPDKLKCVGVEKCKVSMVVIKSEKE